VNPKVLEQSAGGGFYPKLAYYLRRKKMNSHHIIIPPLQIFTFANLKDLLFRIYDSITHGYHHNLGLQVTTFGGRDVACKKTEEGEGSRTTTN
jgi:hypothetical protein